MRELKVGYLGPIRRKYFQENVMENSYLQSRARTVIKTLKEIVTGYWFYDSCRVNTNAAIKTNNIIMSFSLQCILKARNN